MQEVAICPECKKNGDGTIVKAKVYPALLPHSPASTSSVAYVIFEKTFSECLITGRSPVWQSSNCQGKSWRTGSFTVQSTTFIQSM